MNSDKNWYKHSIIYELNLKAFRDANGDGKGDFKGLILELDYFVDLGINCIWLLPIYPSPGRDDGYDVSDYYKINQDYGTIKDFKQFVDQAHSKGIKIVTELILNHTSSDHEWFKKAKTDRNSKYFNYYVWSEDPTRYKDARVIFTDSEVSNWTWCVENKLYYWHRFFSHQPDLNFDNPDVREEMKKVIKFWLDMGVDGFRFDAVPYLFERDGTNCENLQETHDYIKELRRFIDQNYENRMLLAEANQWPEDLIPYFGNGDEFHMSYNFPLMPRLFMALKQEHHGPIVDIVKSTPPIPENCQWAIFLRNHDELTLEMCTDEERDYMYRMYASDPQMKINLGIRRRLAPLLDNDRRKIELLYILLFTLPGSPIIYYGDEIGMGDNIYLGDRNGVRTPMQWNENKNAGFSNCNPSQLYAPVILDPGYNYHSINVESQENSPHSLLRFIKKIIQARTKYSVFGTLNLDFIYPENKKILVFIRKDDNATILCIYNLSASSQPVEVDLSAYRGKVPREILGNVFFPRIGELNYFFTLSPYGYFLFELAD